MHPGHQTPSPLAGSTLHLGNTQEGSSSVLVSHSCPGLGVSYEQRLKDAVFQPLEDTAVPTMPQLSVGAPTAYSQHICSPRLEVSMHCPTGLPSHPPAAHLHNSTSRAAHKRTPEPLRCSQGSQRQDGGIPGKHSHKPPPGPRLLPQLCSPGRSSPPAQGSCPHYRRGVEKGSALPPKAAAGDGQR